MIDRLKQRILAQKIEKVVSESSLVELPHEAFILLGVDSISAFMLTDGAVDFDDNEESELDFTSEELAAILNKCVKEPIYSYFTGDSRLTLRRSADKISDDVYELKFVYKIELKGETRLNLCKDGVHYELDKGESPYQKYELVDKIAEVCNVDAVRLIDQLDYEPCLASLNFIKEYLEDASEVDVYDIISEHLSVADLWSDLLAAMGSPRYDGTTFETSQSFLIDKSNRN